MIYVGIDPSFSRTGVAILNTSNKTLEFSNFSHKIGEKTFMNIFEVADSLTDEIVQHILSKGVSIAIVMEGPLPTSDMSSALYCLDTLLYSKLHKYVKTCFNPTQLMRIHNKRKYSKTDSVNLAREYIQFLKEKGYTTNTERPTHDSSEAFLYLMTFFKSEI